MPYEVHLAISLGENRSRFAPFWGLGPKGEPSDALNSRKWAEKGSFRPLLSTVQVSADGMAERVGFEPVVSFACENSQFLGTKSRLFLRL